MDLAHPRTAFGPAATAPASARSSFLRQVGALTALGLLVSLTVGAGSAVGLGFAVSAVPFLGTWMGQMLVIFGSFAITQYLARGMVESEGPVKWAGFFLGTAFQGVAMGWLLLVAAVVGLQSLGNPFGLILQAFGLVGLLTVGMFAWLMTGPKDLNLVQGGIAMLSLPMLALMIVSFVFPIGGPLGIALVFAFVVISAGGVLVQLNQVMHRYPTNRPVPAAYGVTIGLLVLYWNILSLLIRLQRR